MFNGLKERVARKLHVATLSEVLRSIVMPAHFIDAESLNKDQKKSALDVVTVHDGESEFMRVIDE